MLRKYEMRRLLKNRALFILLIMIVLIGLMNFKELKDRDFNSSDYKELKIAGRDSRYQISLREKIQMHRLAGLEEEARVIELRRENSRKAIEELEKGDFLEAYRYELMNQIMVFNYSSKPEERTSYKKDLMRIWEDVAQGEPYPNPGQQEFKYRSEMAKDMLYIRGLYESYRLGIPYPLKDDANQLNFLYLMMEDFLAIFLIVMILIISSGSISEEHSLKITRNVLAQPMNRFDYFKDVLLANYLLIMLIFFLTIVFLSLLTGFLSEFRSLDMPIVALKNRWTSLRIDGMDLARSDSMPSFLSDGEIFYEGPVALEGGKAFLRLYSSMEFIPFYRVLAIYIISMLAFGFFVSSLTVFISSLTDNRSISLIVSSLILLGLYILMKVFPGLPNPMLAMDTSLIISGLSNYTLLSLALIQALSIGLILFLSRRVFKKIEIVY